MKWISIKMHGVIDYVLVIFLLITPSLFNFNGLGAIFTYTLGCIHLILTLFTDFPMGLIKLVPMRMHSQIELIVSVLLSLMAFIVFRSDYKLELFYTVLSVLIFIVWLFTNYKEVVLSGKLLS